MSAQRLRDAAALMRSRAEGASSGPWTWHEYGGHNGTDPVPYLTGRGGDPETYAYDTEVIEPDHSGECGCRSSCNLELRVRREDREHIASWHPAVALAVADSLDLAAQWAETYVGSNPPWVIAALAVANAYLGTTS